MYSNAKVAARSFDVMTWVGVRRGALTLKPGGARCDRVLRALAEVALPADEALEEAAAAFGAAARGL